MRLRDYREFGSVGMEATAGERAPSRCETGTWAMGTGWEMGLIALDMFLRGGMPTGDDAESFGARPEVAQLADSCGQAWAAVVKAATRGPSAGETT